MSVLAVLQGVKDFSDFYTSFILQSHAYALSFKLIYASVKWVINPQIIISISLT